MIDLSNPTTQAVIGGVIRSLLIAAGAADWGLSGNQIGALAGALAVLVGTAWSIWAKKKATDAHHDVVARAVQAAAANPANASAIIAAAKAGTF